MGRANSQAIQLLFPTAHSTELQFPCICHSECFLRYFLFLSSFRARAGYCGASSRITATPPTSPLTPLLSPRDGGDARTTPPGVRRARPGPGAPLTVGKLSPEPSHQPSRHGAGYLKSRQARRRFSSAPVLPLLVYLPSRPRPAPGPEPQPERRGKMAAVVRAAGLGPIGVGGAELGR